MIAALERLGDRVLSALVPRVEADAAGSAACTYPSCGGCVTCEVRYKRCCNGVCGPCGNPDPCC
jgi:hypothetical protein